MRQFLSRGLTGLYNAQVNRIIAISALGAMERSGMELERRLRTQWTEAAQSWIDTDHSVRTGMLDAWMLDALGDVSGRTVIDIGCGEGRFCRLLSERGAKVTGVDLTMTPARALGRGDQSYLVGDAVDLACVEDASFDLAVSYIVLVDLLDYRRAIGAAYRVLNPGGRLVVCNIHPMRSADSGGWFRQGTRKLFYPLDSYCDEGPREFEWLGTSIVNMHRTLSSYVSAFLEAGFAIEGLHEPTPSEAQLTEHPEFDDEFRAPNFIVYTLMKPHAPQPGYHAEPVSAPDS